MINVLIYPGQSEDLIEVQLMQQNQNKRSTINNSLHGYFQGTDGIYYPLDMESSSEPSIKYGGIAVQSLLGRVPKAQSLTI
ncbi:hypothetical protein PaeBR_06515 [Paenibacillus sp. BR2-3]|uniref:hypothetical protein n=1 Tax=Paenibacillus sp. BR2-3 TaxID=3048494 RepID=UPI003977561D